VTHLRKTMLEELERRNYTAGTIRQYLRFVEEFARHFGKSPDKLGFEDLRSCQVYLLRSGSRVRRRWRTTSPRCGSSSCAP
jgi:hypothetical protein